MVKGIGRCIVQQRIFMAFSAAEARSPLFE
jgi:hypothetical protein